ncbi:MAG: hypothetical protein PHS97_05495 [Oscillospiraceae bacterium]|nr:hypothetical protein [Oscillospiraceae bacterium]
MNLIIIKYLQKLQSNAILYSKDLKHPFRSGSRTVIARHDSRNFMAGALYPFTLDLQKVSAIERSGAQLLMRVSTLLQVLFSGLETSGKKKKQIANQKEA